MSFWNTSDGEDVTKTAEKEYDAGGGFDLIPDKTTCLMNLERAAWKEDRDGNSFINVQWSVLKPDAFARSTVFQKLWVKDDDPSAKDAAKKRDKALKMLSTIDANAGGKLAKAGREPDDDDLALALTNKQMLAKVMVWSMADRDNPGKNIEGNWIAQVGPAKGGSMTVSEVTKAVTKREPAKSMADELDDDVPF